MSISKNLKDLLNSEVVQTSYHGGPGGGFEWDMAIQNTVKKEKTVTQKVEPGLEPVFVEYLDENPWENFNKKLRNINIRFRLTEDLLQAPDPVALATSWDAFIQILSKCPRLTSEVLLTLSQLMFEIEALRSGSKNTSLPTTEKEKEAFVTALTAGLVESIAAKTDKLVMSGFSNKDLNGSFFIAPPSLLANADHDYLHDVTKVKLVSQSGYGFKTGDVVAITGTDGKVTHCVVTVP